MINRREKTRAQTTELVRYRREPQRTKYDERKWVTYRTESTRPLFELIFPEFPNGRMRKFSDIDEMDAVLSKWCRRHMWYGFGPYLVCARFLCPDYDKLTVTELKLGILNVGKRPRSD